MPIASFIDKIKARFSDVERVRSDMHTYQADEAVPFLRKNPFSALFIDMGLGKTVSAGTVIADLLADFEITKVLIIAPLKVATDTWPTEFRLWEHLAPFEFTVIREDDSHPALAEARRIGREKGRKIAADFELSPEQTAKVAGHLAGKYEQRVRIKLRQEAALSKTPIHIINREQVEWLVYFFKGKWPYRTVIIDESSSFKDYKSGRFIALAKIRAANGGRLITRMHLLTATPAAETYEHLWAQIFLLDRGRRLGQFITHYRKQYFSFDPYKRKFVLQYDAEEKILKKIADICLVMKKKDYFETIDPVMAVRRVILSSEQMALYEEMQTNFVVTLPDGKQIESETAAALSSKLLQMASGVLYETYQLEDYETGDLKKVRKVHHLHDHKIEMLEEIVEESQGESLLVVYHHQSSLARLKQAFPKATVMDREGKCIKAWNKKKIPMLFIHPQSGGHGLNLQHGGHNIIFFDLPWSLENYQQVIGRLDRQGQTNQVVIQPLIAVGTVDEIVFAALNSKQDAQEKMFIILKRLIKKHRKELEWQQTHAEQF